MDFDPNKDYYKILGLSEDANADDIKKAFRKLAVKHHPDRGGSKEEFQKMNEAYQVLSDSQKKSQYDSFKKGGFGGIGGGGVSSGGGFDFGGAGGFDFGGVDLGDIVGSVFGGGFGEFGGGASMARKGNDLQRSINISFNESYSGVEKKIIYTRYVIVKGAEKRQCGTCKGSGRIAKQTRTPFGVVQTQSFCDVCGGLGNMYFKDGKELANGGLVVHKDTMIVKIPAGIKDGVFLKYVNKGDDGLAGMPAGDLYIRINVTPSKKYYRKGDDIYVDLDVSVYDLVLGAEYKIDHPEGKMKLKIPKGTQIGQKVRIVGKGFGVGGFFGKKGDVLVEPKVSIPKKLSKDQEKLWKGLQGSK